MFRAGLVTNPICYRCSHMPADFFHMIWYCPVITQYWEAVVAKLSDVLDLTMDFSPMLIILGVDDGVWGSRDDLAL